MANQNGPLENVIGFLGLVGFLIVIYLVFQSYKKNMRKINPVIQANIQHAEVGAGSGSEEDYQIIPEGGLLDMRSRQGSQQLTVIDTGGSIFVNKKGIHYVGLHRRLSWEWKKIMEIRSSRFVYEIQFQIVVSNRQKISGFKFIGTQATREIVYSFLDRRLLLQKNSPSTKISRNPQQKGPETATNVTYNIVQNVQDSVIQGNFEIKDK